MGSVSSSLSHYWPVLAAVLVMWLVGVGVWTFLGKSAQEPAAEGGDTFDEHGEQHGDEGAEHRAGQGVVEDGAFDDKTFTEPTDGAADEPSEAGRGDVWLTEDASRLDPADELPGVDLEQLVTSTDPHQPRHAFPDSTDSANNVDSADSVDSPYAADNAAFAVEGSPAESVADHVAAGEESREVEEVEVGQRADRDELGAESSADLAADTAAEPTVEPAVETPAAIAADAILEEAADEVGTAGDELGSGEAVLDMFPADDTDVDSEPATEPAVAGEPAAEVTRAQARQARRAQKAAERTERSERKAQQRLERAAAAAEQRQKRDAAAAEQRQRKDAAAAATRQARELAGEQARLERAAREAARVAERASREEAEERARAEAAEQRREQKAAAERARVGAAEAKRRKAQDAQRRKEALARDEAERRAQDLAAARAAATMGVSADFHLPEMPIPASTPAGPATATRDTSVPATSLIDELAALSGPTTTAPTAPARPDSTAGVAFAVTAARTVFDHRAYDLPEPLPRQSAARSASTEDSESR